MFLIMVSFRFSLIFYFPIRYSYFDSGTGAAGIADAFLWWDVRGVFSVRLPFSLLVDFELSHMFLLQLIPSIIPLTYSKAFK